MGKDFIRRRNDSFVRQRDARFAEQLTPDLFSVCAPTVAVNVCGTMLNNSVHEKSELWTPEVAANGPIRFYEGDVAVVELDGDAAAKIRQDYGKSDGPVVAEVIELESDHGLVLLKVGCGR